MGGLWVGAVHVVGGACDGRSVGRSGPCGGEGRTVGRCPGGAVPVLGRLLGFANASLTPSLLLGVP